LSMARCAQAVGIRRRARLSAGRLAFPARGLSVLICLYGNQAEHLALLFTDQFMERNRRCIAGQSGLHRTAGSTRRRLSDHMIHVISPRHLAISGQPGPYPQASRTAQPPDPGPPLLRVRGGLQPRDHRSIAAQHLCTLAHVTLFHAHPARLTGGTAAEADGSISSRPCTLPAPLSSGLAPYGICYATSPVRPTPSPTPGSAIATRLGRTGLPGFGYGAGKQPPQGQER